MLATVGLILLISTHTIARQYNVFDLPKVSYNVVRRIFPHATESDMLDFIDSINNCTDTEKRKDMTLDFVETKFGVKMSYTDSPFDDKEYSLHKMWSLIDQRLAIIKFFQEANRQLKDVITMGLASELFELFEFLDTRYDHLFPAASVAWIESITVTLSYNQVLDPESIVQKGLLQNDPEAAFLLLYWELYDQTIETNVLFL